MSDLVQAITIEKSTFLPLLLLLTMPAAAYAQADRAAERGRAFAQIACSRCHAIGPTGDSPLAEAPPFRVLHQRYPVEDIEESLAEGIKTGHPMPEFQLDSAEIQDLLAYLKSLEH
jgi:cytochrome c